MKLVKSLKTTLYSPLTASASSVVLSDFDDMDGTNLAMSDFGDWGVIVIKQGTTVEIIKFSGLTQNSNGTATLTVATNGRSIAGTSPYAGASTGEDFQVGAEVIVSNDPLTLSRFANLDVAGTFTQIMTFSALPQITAGNPVSANDVARKAYVDSVVAGIATTVNLVVSGTAGETLVAGNLIYFDDATNYWKLCDADTAASVENVMLGIAQGAGTVGVLITSGVLLRGLDANQSGLTAGAIYYASNTAGGLSSSAGTTEVTIGFAYSATQLYFNPRFNQQLTEDQQDALAGTSGTPSATNKFVTSDGLTTQLATKANVVFGGTGADGALSIASGTTNIDVGGVQYYIKNYSSISITGTGALTFSNPHANGTIIILKSQGGVTITSSATPAIDVSSMGATGGTGGAVSSNGNIGTVGIGSVVNVSAGAGGVAGTSGSGGAGGAASVFTYPLNISGKIIKVSPGAGGGEGGGNGGSSGGDGGKGGGALIIECAGALNFTGNIYANGAVGTDGVDSTVGAGGGGGGAAGTVAIIYNTLTANTGTITVTGGTGGQGGDASTTNNETRGAGGGGGAHRFAGGAGGNLSGSTGVASGGAGGAGGTVGVAGSAGTTPSGGAGGGGGGGSGGERYVVLNTEFA